MAEAHNRRLKLKNHRTVEQFRVKKILATRELKANPEYKPNFVNYPLRFEEVEIALSDKELNQLQRLRFADYQENDEILRETVMRWVFRNRTRQGKLKRSASSE